MRVMIKSCSKPTHRPSLCRHTQVLVHNQYVGVNQNSLKHYPTSPHINPPYRMASTLFRPPSPLQILIPPSEFTWPTSPASLRAAPSQGTSSALPQSFPPKFSFRRLLPQPPLPHFKFYQPFVPTLIQTCLYAWDTINSASSFPRDCHAKSFLHC